MVVTLHIKDYGHHELPVIASSRAQGWTVIGSTGVLLEADALIAAKVAALPLEQLDRRRACREITGSDRETPH